MTFMSLTPATTAHDATGAFEILQLLTNDTKYKQRFEEMQQLARHLAQYKDDGEATRRSADEIKVAADQAMAEVSRKLAESKDLHHRAMVKQGELEAYERRLAEYEQELEAKAHEHFASREAALKDKELQLAEIEKALVDKEVELMTRRLEHEKLEKQLAGDHSHRLGKHAEAEAVNRREAAALAEMRKELEAKMAKLKASLASI